MAQHSLDIFIANSKWYKPEPGRTLIAGSQLYEGSVDRRGDFKGEVVGVDAYPGEGVDHVHDLEEPLPFGYFDHVHCCSVLEHVSRPWLAAHNLQQCLRVGGTILLAVPFTWRVHGYPDDYFRFTASGVRSLFPDIRWLELSYLLSDGTLAAKPRAKRSDAGGVFLERSEVVGFGVKQ